VTLCHLIFFLSPEIKDLLKEENCRMKKNTTAEENAVPLGASELLLYQLLEICKKCDAVRGVSLKEDKTVLFFFVHICSCGIFPGTVLCEHIVAFVTSL
jgi:hypothetical protein